jgi:DNA repair protein radC
MDTNETKIQYNRSIKDIAVDDRPREKALKYGINSLSATELIAIMLGSGSPGESVIDLSQRILKASDNKLSNLVRKTVPELTRDYKGVGNAKAISILAALQLGQKLAEEVYEPNRQICDSISAYDFIKHDLAHISHEEFWIILLNRSKRVIGKLRISQGGVAATVVDIKILLKTALEHLASSIILVHNHPSNNLVPSLSDDALTKRISEGGKILDIDVVDHLIVSHAGYYSYADEGKI